MNCCRKVALLKSHNNSNNYKKKFLQCCIKETPGLASRCSRWWYPGYLLWFCPTSNSVPQDNVHWQQGQQKLLSTADITKSKAPGVFEFHHYLTSSPLTCRFSKYLATSHHPKTCILGLFASDEWCMCVCPVTWCAGNPFRVEFRIFIATTSCHLNQQ